MCIRLYMTVIYYQINLAAGTLRKISGFRIFGEIGVREDGSGVSLKSEIPITPTLPIGISIGIIAKIGIPDRNRDSDFKSGLPIGIPSTPSLPIGIPIGRKSPGFRESTTMTMVSCRPLVANS